MGQQVVMGGLMSCSFGVAPSSLVVTQATVMASKMPAANIMDYMPISNIPPFGMCSSIANPTVATATAAASGVLTPMPCIPNVVAPWAPGSPTVMVRKMPALNNSSKAACLWGGVISITFGGQATVNVP